MSSFDPDIPYTVEPRPDTGLYNGKVGIWLFLASEVMLFGALFSSYIMLRVGAETWPQGMLNVPLGTLNTFILLASSITLVTAWAALQTRDFSRFKLYQGLTVLLALAFLLIKGYEYHDKFTHYYVRLKDGRELTGHLAGKPFNWSLATLTDPRKPIASIVLHPDATPHAPADAAGHAAPASGHAEPLTIPTDQLAKLESFGPWRNTYFAIYFVLTGLHGLHVLGGILVLAYLWGPGSRMWSRQPERFTNRLEVTGLYWHFVDLVWVFVFPVLYLF